MAQSVSWRDWHLPLSAGHLTLAEGLAELAEVGAAPGDIPLIIRLVENPQYDLPGFDIFHGAVDLAAHDAIHLVLGRGLLPKDEAFVIGFTMGSTRRVTTTEERLFTLIAKHLYPGIYRFDEADARVFRDAVRLGFVCDCRPLDKIGYAALRPFRLDEIRAELGVDEGLLRAYYAIEKRRHPEAPESRRLLD